MVRQLEVRIREAEKDYTKKHKYKPQFIALSVYGYTELKRELAAKNAAGEEDWESDVHEYNGLTILVSQDPEFEDFTLLS